MRRLLLLAVLAPAAALALWARPAGAAPPQTVVLTIRPAPSTALLHVGWRDVHARMTPDERVTGSNFAVRPGALVRVVVWNYTSHLHSFTAPKLGVNVAILPGSAAHPHRAVFTFRARTSGRIEWHCGVPCGGYMGGNVYAIIGARTFA